ncbi:MAG: hypothetical protein ACYDD2_06425, partial [Candidatus Acidiferrales bacterium]
MNKIYRISLMALTLAIAVCFGCAGTASARTPQAPANAVQAFATLKTLAGRWKATTAKGKASATYQLVSGGTAVLERMKMAGEQEMITVYYLDGNRLL